MDNLTGLVLEDGNGDVVRIVGITFIACLCVYMIAIMVRRFLRVRQRRLERVVRSAVRRELCALFEIMLVRFERSPLPACGHCVVDVAEDSAPSLQSARAPEVDASPGVMLTPDGGFDTLKLSLLSITTPRGSINALEDPTSSSSSNPPACRRGRTPQPTSRDRPPLWPTRSAGARPEVPFVVGTPPTSTTTGPTVASPEELVVRLLRDLRAFAALTEPTLLTDEERHDAVERVLIRVHARVAWAGTPATRTLVCRTLDTEYAVQRREMVQGFLRFLISVRPASRPNPPPGHWDMLPPTPTTHWPPWVPDTHPRSVWKRAN